MTISVGIIGAGMAGASCAEFLDDRGFEVVIYEKSRGHGGRASTRYGDEGRFTFDHGAQYFTVSDDSFREKVQAWEAGSIVDTWEVNPAILEGGTVRDYERDTERFVGTPTMNRMIKALSSSVEKRFEHRVTKLKYSEEWTLHFENQVPETHDIVVLTAPPPQTTELLQDSLPELGETTRSVNMQPTWCLLLGLDREVDVPYDAAFVNDQGLDWICRNSSKPGRSPTETWVIHASHEWSRDHLEASGETVKNKLLKQFETLTDCDVSSVFFNDVHRWRYAKADNPMDDHCLAKNRLIVAGDWLAGSRIEGAYLSGRAAGEKSLRLIERLL